MANSLLLVHGGMAKFQISRYPNQLSTIWKDRSLWLPRIFANWQRLVE